MIIMTIRFRTTWIIIKYLKCLTYCSCWTYYSWSNYAWCFLLGLIPRSKNEGTYFYSTPMEHLTCSLQSWKLWHDFLKFFYQFLKWLSSIWNYRTSCSTKQQWGTCQKVLGRHENARRQRNTIHYIPQVTMSFSIFFLFQFHGFKTCGLLYVELTQENQKFTTFYIYFL
jgi:hypothetical protein